MIYVQCCFRGYIITTIVVTEFRWVLDNISDVYDEFIDISDQYPPEMRVPPPPQPPAPPKVIVPLPPRQGPVIPLPQGFGLVNGQFVISDPSLVDPHNPNNPPLDLPKDPPPPPIDPPKP